MTTSLPTPFRTLCLIALLLVLAPFHAQAQDCVDTFVLASQAEVDAFDCATVTGTVTVTGADITNLDGLSELTSVSSFLYVRDNPELTSLSGLAGLTTLDGDLALENNAKLTSTAGLGALTSIGVNLFIKGNTLLTSLEGLQALRSVGSAGGAFFAIENNPALPSLAGLEDLLIVENDNFILQGNTALSDCADGLSSLISGDPPAFTGITDKTPAIANNASSGMCNSPADVLLAARSFSLTTTDFLETQTELRWDRFTGTRHFYRIEREGTLLAVASSDEISYRDTTGDPGTTYTYCITVVENGTDLLTSCAPGSRHISKPTEVRATDSTLETEVSFTWTDRSEIEASYVLTRDGAALATLPANSAAYRDTSAVPGTMYTYCVRAEDANGFASTQVCDVGTRAFVTPPGSVAATDGRFPHSVRIIWTDQTTTEDLFTIYRYLGPDTTAVTPDLLGTVPADSTLFDDDPGVDTLGDGVVYTYCVTSTTGSTESIQVCDEGRAGGLTPPADVAASVDTFDDRVQITWSDVADTEDAFRIARGGVVLDTLAAGAELYNDFTAAQGTDYEYCVQAFSEADPDNPSLSAEGCADGRRSNVLAPTNVSASDDAFEEHVEIVWQNVSTTAMLINLYRVEGSDTTLIRTLSPSFAQALDAEVASDTAHAYCVAAVTVPGASSALQSQVEQLVAQVAMQEQVEVASGAAPFRTSGLSAQRLLARVEAAATASEGIALTRSMNASTAIVESGRVCEMGSRSITPPTDVAATYDAFEDHVQVSWQNNSGVQTGFVVYRHTEAEPTPVAVDSVGPNRTSRGDYTGVPGVTYTYSVTAFDAYGESEAATDRGRRTLLAPTVLQASKGTSETEIRLTWIDNARAEDGYYIYRREASAADSTVIDTTAASATSFTDTFDPIDLAKEFIYSIVAFDAYGTSDVATDSGYTTILAPSNLSASTTYDDQVTLNWTNTSAIHEGVHIYRNGDSLGTTTNTAAQLWQDYTSSPPDFAVSLDGVDDEVIISTDPSNGSDRVDLPTGGFTIEFWLKRNSEAPGWVLSQGTSSTNNGLHIGFRPDRDNFTFAFWGNDLETPYDYADTDWHHWALTYNATSLERKIYLDGTEIASDVATAAYAGSGVLHVGNRFGFTGNELNGLLDELRIWDSMRTSEQIAATMSTRLIGDEGGLFGYWPFDEGVGSLAKNLAGEATGRLRNGAAWTNGALAVPPLPGVTYEYCIEAFVNNLASEQVCSRGGIPPIPVPPPTTPQTIPDILLANDRNTDDDFGFSVSVDGDYAIIGAPRVGNNVGAAYIYKRNGANWNQHIRLTAGDPNDHDRFGWSVAIKGDYAIVGADGDDGAGSNYGAAYIFKREGDSWIQTAKLTGGQGAFGYSVAIDGEYALIGSFSDDQRGNNAGAAYVFKRNGTSWTEQAELFASDAVQNEWFGTSVALQGEYAVIGAERHDTGINQDGFDVGAAYVFKRNGTTWTEQQQLLASDGAKDDWLGNSVAIHDGHVMIGAPLHRTGTVRAAGAVYFFNLEEDGTWGRACTQSGQTTSCYETQKLTVSDIDENDNFGRRGISMDGEYALLPAYGSNNWIGSSYLFRWESGTWSEVLKINPSTIEGDEGDGTDEGALFGISSSLQGSNLLIGASQYGYGTNQTGAVFVAPIVVKPLSVEASDGSYPDRVQVTWDDVNLYESNFRIYRRADDGTLEIIGTAEADGTSFDDFSAAPGGAYEYCVTAFSQEVNAEFGDMLGESLPTCTTGWRPPNGSISGRVASLGGGGTTDVQVCLSDPNPNRSLYFDGVGGEVVITGPLNSDVHLPKDGFTIEFWAKRAVINSNEYILSQGTDSINNGLHAGFQAENIFRFSFWGNNLDTPEYTDTDWNHWALTYNGKRRQIYRNGAVVVADQEDVPSYTGSGPLYLGVLDFFARDDNFFGGQLDELRIWHGVRDSNEIAAYMRTPLRGDEINLFGYWPLEQSSRNVAPDRSGNGFNGVIRGNADWATKGAFPVCATTDSAGNYSIAGINYGEESSFTVTPSRENRAFDPPFSKITLSSETPVQNQVGFTDVTAFTVAGIVEYRGTACPVPNAEILVDGTLTSTTEPDGTFSVSVDPSADPADLREIELRLTNPQDAEDTHTFDPATRQFFMDEDKLGLAFVDNKTRQLTINFSGSCNTAIGTARIRIFTEDGCYDEEIEVSGLQTIPLPPQNYLVEVLTVDTDSDLRADIIQFFNNLGAQEIDLTQQADTLDLIYRAPVSLTISGLPELPMCSSETIKYLSNDGTVLRSLPVVPVLKEGDTAELTIAAFEDYGDPNNPDDDASTHCPVDVGTITVYDAIAGSEDPVSLVIQDGEAVYGDNIIDNDGNVLIAQGSRYTTQGIGPNVLAGTIIDGVDRSFQRSITAIADVPGLPAVATTEWAIIEGMRSRTGTFVTATTDPIPMLVLHDPPGSHSYAYLEKGTTMCQRISSIYVSDIGGGPLVDVAVGFKAGAGFGFIVENGVGVNFSARSLIGQENSRLSAGACQDYTASLNALIPDLNLGGCDGEDLNGDGRINALDRNLEICMTTTERISTSADPVWVGEDLFMGAGLNLTFAEADVLNVDKQECELDLSETVALDDLTFETTYVYGETHIRESLIPALQELAETAPKDKGIGSQSFKEAISNWNRQLGLNQDIEKAAFSNTCYRITSNGIRFLDPRISILPEDRESMGIQCGDDGIFQRENLSYSAGVDLERSVTADTVQTLFAETSRFYIENEGSVGLIATLAGYDQKAQIAFVVNGEFIQEESKDETSTQTAGYVLSDNDPGDFFSVDVSTDPLFLTPVFRNRSGRSSNPWEPWYDSEGLPTTQKRDNLVLSIFPPELRDVPADQEGTFTLSLSNDSESQEQREYVLHIAKPENPKSLFMSITGDPIDGETYHIKPGQTQEVTLQVARGQTSSFAYSYEDVAMYAYPEREYEIWQMDPRQPFVLSDTAFFSVYFEAPCSDIDILEPKDLWSLNTDNAALGITLDGFRIPVSETDTVATVGLEYRRAGAGGAFGNSWLPVDAIDRDALGDVATSWQIPGGWTPEQDGDYELRAFTECEIAGPGKRVYSPTISGTRDTTPPLVLGLPEPADDILSLGDAVSVTFTEEIDCGSIVTLQGSSGQNALLTYADGTEAGDDIPIVAACSGTTLSFLPDAAQGISWADFENRRLTMTLLGAGNAAGNNGDDIAPPMDLAGNLLPQQAISSSIDENVNWSFVVQRNALAWSPTNLPLGNAAEVSSTLYNGRATEVAFTLEDIPAYLVPSLDGATIPPGGQLRVNFAVDLAASFGPMLPDTIRAASPTGDALLYLTCQDPTWSVNPAAYQYSMGITGRLFTGGLLSDDTDDMVAAFVGNQLRGVASVADANGNLTPLTVYSNSPFGETVTFRIFDASECLTYPSATMTFTFNNGDTIGSETQPVAFEGTFTLPQQQVDLAQGWTWFSLNRTPAEASPATVLGTVGATPGDVLKSQTSFSLYDDGAGWVGALSGITPGSAYQVRLAQASTLVLGGPKVRPDSALAIMTGWNWLGYLPEVPLDIATAMGSTADTYVPSEDDVLKSQFGFETYSSGAWVPGTMVLTPGQGYMLMSNSDAQFQYPGATTTTVETEPTVLAVRSSTARDAFASEERGAAPQRTKVVHSTGDGTEPEAHGPTEAPAVTPSAYTHSMTLIGSVTLDDLPAASEDTRIWLTDEDGTVRGNAALHYIDALQDYRLFLMLYSDLPQGEAFEVHVHDPATGHTVTLDKRLNFKANHHAGSITEPVLIAAESEAYKAAKAAAEIPETYALDQNYPNPFNPTTAIRYGLPESGEVSLIVYDVLGREVIRLVDGQQQAGWHTVSFDGRNLASGMYLYRLEAGAFKQVQTMMLVK